MSLFVQSPSCGADPGRRHLGAALRTLCLASLVLAVAGCATSRRAGSIDDAATRPASSDCPRALSLDRDAIAREAACRLAQYIRIDTTNPGGSEAEAAAFLAEWLTSEGIASSIVESAPGRANLLARLPGRSHDNALMLVHHMDVVPARAGEWSVPPFEGIERDGAVWGRGSLDNKGAGIIQFLAAVMIRRLGIQLDHDLVLLAVADEEAGGGHGARFLTAQHGDWFRGVRHVLNEGGAVIDFGAAGLVYNVEVAQKAPLWLRLTVRGRPGHASAPGPESAVTRLVRALARLSRFRFPVVVLPQVERLFAARAATLPEDLRAGASHLRRAMKRRTYRNAFLKDPRRAALVRNTFAITMLEGSTKENVIPGQASAVVDLRLLPGQDPDEVTRLVETVLADPQVEVSRLLSWQAAESTEDNDLFRAVEAFARRRSPDATVVPAVIGGFTDCNAFRAAGMTCLGFLPLELEPTSFAGVHGRDERIEIRAMAEAVVALEDLVRSVERAAGPDSGP